MSRHPYNGLGQDTRDRDGTQGRYFDDFKHPTVRPTQIVRPLAFASGGAPIKVVQCDQIGSVDSDNPGNAATARTFSAGFDESGPNIFRAFGRFSEGIDGALVSQLIVNQGVFAISPGAVIGGLTRSAIVEFITNSDLDLANVTFSNQGSLTFTGSHTIKTFVYDDGDFQSLVTEIDTNSGIVIAPASRPSVTVYGFRVKMDDESDPGFGSSGSTNLLWGNLTSTGSTVFVIKG